MGILQVPSRLDSSAGRALYQCSRSHGFESRLSLIFVRFSFETVLLLCMHNCDNLECLKHIFLSQTFKYVVSYVSYYYLPVLAQKSLFVSFGLHKGAKRAISVRASTNRSREQSSLRSRTELSYFGQNNIRQQLNTESENRSVNTPK